MKLLALVFVFAASVAAHAQKPADMKVFGYELGKPLALEACRCPGCVSEPVIMRDCLDMEVSGRAGRNMVEIGTVHFPVDRVPQLVKGDTCMVATLNGALVDVMFKTKGVADQDVVFATLVAKYGTPSSKATIPVRTAMGAFESIRAEWRIDGVLVAFSGSLDSVSEGYVEVSTPSGRGALKSIAASHPGRPL
jgi:hypothetical protein